MSEVPLYRCWASAALPARQRKPYRGTSPIRNSAPLGPYSRTIPRTLWKPWGGGLFLMSEVPLATVAAPLA